ncbi:hypothetical protein Egran_00021, partial [Elaphomyces granulatus]
MCLGQRQLSRKRAASTTHCNGCRRYRPDADFVHEGHPERPYKTCKVCRDRRSKQYSTQRALLSPLAPSTTIPARPPMFVERHEPPSVAPDVTTI